MLLWSVEGIPLPQLQFAKQRARTGLGLSFSSTRTVDVAGGVARIVCGKLYVYGS